MFIGFFFPGDTLLLQRAFLPPRANYLIAATIVVIALAAIAGDNTGYHIGKRYGRRLFRKKDGLFFQQEYVSEPKDFISAGAANHAIGPLLADYADLRATSRWRSPHELPTIRHLRRHRRHRLGGQRHAGRLLVRQQNPGPRPLHPASFSGRNGNHARSYALSPRQSPASETSPEGPIKLRSIVSSNEHEDAEGCSFL